MRGEAIGLGDSDHHWGGTNCHILCLDALPVTIRIPSVYLDRQPRSPSLEPDCMGVIATLLPNSTHLQRLRTAIRDRHTLVMCEDFAALLRTCESQPVRLAIVDLFAGGRANF